MPRIVPLLVAVTAILAIWGAPPEASAAAPAAADSAAIRAAALDYVEGWYEGDAARMERALHPELAKRIVRTDPQTGRSRLEQMGAMRLVQSTRAGGGTRTPKEQRIRQVTILDIFENAASVKAEMAGWIDYMHLGKADGRWVIVNVLWEMRPEKP
jgi:hypothetical protein